MTWKEEGGVEREGAPRTRREARVRKSERRRGEWARLMFSLLSLSLSLRLLNLKKNSSNDARFLFRPLFRRGGLRSPGHGSGCCCFVPLVCCSQACDDDAPRLQARAERQHRQQHHHQLLAIDLDQGGRDAHQLPGPRRAADAGLRQRRGRPLLQDGRSGRRASGAAQGARRARAQGRHDSASVSFYILIFLFRFSSI